MTPIRLMLALTLATLVAGCGFHLRGKIDLPAHLSTYFVKGTDAELRAQLEDALVFSGADIVDDETLADAVLDLIDIAFLRQVRSLDNRGLATGYELTYSVKFEMHEAEGKVLLEESAISLSRALAFDGTQILQVENEQQFLREDMQREMAQRILQRLATITAVGPTAPVLHARLDRTALPTGV